MTIRQPLSQPRRLSTRARFAIQEQRRRALRSSNCRKSWLMTFRFGAWNAKSKQEKTSRRAREDHQFFRLKSSSSRTDTGNYRKRVLHKLARDSCWRKFTFQVIRRTIAPLAQKKGTVKDVQCVLRHSRTATDAYAGDSEERAIHHQFDQSIKNCVEVRSSKGGSRQEPALSEPVGARVLHV